jgi:hypothetical protein
MLYLTSLSSHLLEKLILAHLIKTFLVFYGNRRSLYRLHHRPPLAPVLCRFNPVHTFTHYLRSIFNIVLPSVSGFLEWSDCNFVRISRFSSMCYMPCPSYPPCLDHPNNIWWRDQIMKHFTVLIFSSCYFLLGFNILLSTLLCAPYPLKPSGNYMHQLL